LQAGGAPTTVFVPERGEGWLGRQLQGSGVAIAHFRIDRPIAPSCVRSLARQFQEHRISIAHSHEFSMAVYGAWAAKLAGIPHVITMHGGRYYAGRLRRRLALKTAIAISGRTVAVSNSVAGALRHDLGLAASRVIAITNGVRHMPPATTRLREELGLEADARLAVAVGSLYAVKGHRHLIEAVDLIARRYPDLHVAIAGRGDQADALEARARELGLQDRVHLLGLRADVPAIIAAADVFVLPSLSEGLPLALLEAMFEARPIIASEVGDVRVALADGDAGLLVPPGDTRALASALETLLGDRDHARALGAAAAARAEAEYDLARMVDRYVEVYRQLVPAARWVAPPAWKPDSSSAHVT
jgi:glycosyltransferase involved in cell wall biosynthesis